MSNQYKDSNTFDKSMDTASKAIHDMFDVKSSSYTQGYRRLAEIEAVLLRDKPVHTSDISAIRAFFVNMILVKMVRFCDHIMHPEGHLDSALDMAVYAKMLLAFEYDIKGDSDEAK